MEDRETAWMRKYGESKTTRIMMATVPRVTSGLGLKKISGWWIFVDTSRVTQCHIPDECQLHGTELHKLILNSQIM